MIYLDGIAFTRLRRSPSKRLASIQVSSSKLFLPRIIPNMRDRTNIECKSSAVALKSRRIATKSS